MHHPGGQPAADVVRVGEGVVVLHHRGEVFLPQPADVQARGEGEGVSPQVGRLGAGLALLPAVALAQVRAGGLVVGGGQAHGLNAGAQGLPGLQAVRRQQVQLAGDLVQQHPVRPQGNDLRLAPLQGLEHIHIAQGVPLQVGLGLFCVFHSALPLLKGESQCSPLSLFCSFSVPQQQGAGLGAVQAAVLQGRGHQQVFPCRDTLQGAGLQQGNLRPQQDAVHLDARLLGAHGEVLHPQKAQAKLCHFFRGLGRHLNVPLDEQPGDAPGQGRLHPLGGKGPGGLRHQAGAHAFSQVQLVDGPAPGHKMAGSVHVGAAVAAQGQRGEIAQVSRGQFRHRLMARLRVPGEHGGGKHFLGNIVDLHTRHLTAER